MDQLTEYILKGAEAANTYGMPLSAPTGKSAVPPKTIPKTGSIESLVDTTGKTAPKTVATKVAQQYALPQHAAYPLDTYTQVKTACAYFEEYAPEFELDTRRVFAVNLVKRASELGIEPPPSACLYGSTAVADPTDRLIALEGRRGVLPEAFHGALDRVKVAAAQLAPDDVVLLLQEFDKHTGIDRLYGTDILDPYRSVFAKVAEAQLTDSPQGAIVIGNDYMPIESLKRFVAGARPALVVMYGDAVADKFQQDPVGTFNTFTKSQQRVLMRMVNDNSHVGSVNT